MSGTTARGRRPGSPGTRALIIERARELFAERGYERTSLRGVARAAGVDPALLVHYFGGKDGLFAAALELPVDPAGLDDAVDVPKARLGEAVTRFYLSIWEDPASGPAAVALLRSAATNEAAGALLREFVERVVLGRLVGRIRDDHPELRAALAGSQLIGVALARHVLRVGPLAGVPVETVVAAVSPAIQRYLTGAVDFSSRA
ncbi:TetR/AcrR family transcriptional regulator [Naumannella huperziae]